MSFSDVSTLPWRAGPDGLWLGTWLRISFQRCAPGSGGIHDRAPSSLGALPLSACGSNEFLLPIADDEAVWLGLSTCTAPAPVRLVVQAKTHFQGVLNVCSGKPWEEDTVSHHTFQGISTIDGIYRDDRTVWAFQRCSPASHAPTCEALIFQASPAVPQQGVQVSREAKILLVDYAAFERAAGYAPPPLNPKAGYGGWLLP